MIFKELTLFLLLLIESIACFEYFSNDPDIDRNGSQIIESRGFLSETHHIMTFDGYILTAFRIINPYLNVSGYPVLFMHGFFQSSDTLLLASPGYLGRDGIYREDNNYTNNCEVNGTIARTLPFVLSACGYDVWLGNVRGNRYSTHIHLDQNINSNYWNFSMDDYSYDIIAKIDYIKRNTRRDSMGYIGYSLGTTIVFQLLATKPYYSLIIRPFISLGPFVYIGHLYSPILRILTVFQPILSSLTIPLARIGAQGSLSPYVGRWFCGYSMFTELCVVAGFLFGGFDYPQLNRTQIPRIFSHFPDSSSSIALAHVGQRIMNQNFSFYSGSPDFNRQMYGSETAPNYNISRINSTDIYIFNGQNDWISGTTDVDILVNQLNVSVRRNRIPYELWAHGDFIFANDVNVFVNKPILEILSSYT